MKRIAVLSSGGDAPGMNAALRAVVRTANTYGIETVGVMRGYEGLIEGDFKLLKNDSVGDIIQYGGTILKTARSERFKSYFGQDEAVQQLHDFDIDALVVCGGDGSFRGAADLTAKGITCMCIPCTIDNDQGYTDFTVGFDTAVNTVLDAISKIRDTASAHDRTTVVEVMGRNCGDIALYSGVTGGADFILIPEVKPDIEAIVKKTKEGLARGKRHSIIIKAEGVNVSVDDLCAILSERTDQEVRSVTLAYLQRGGSPTARDRWLATMFGSRAVELIAEDSPSRAIGISRGEIIDMPITDAVKIKREADLDMLTLIDDLSK
ncbi:MAG: 6-phosphofructokinase [Anaerovoracaceae bacterium]|jgi:6-phosphofructokinase 1